MSSIDWKRVLQSGNLSFRKRKKSAGAISGEYGGSSMIFIEFLAFTRLSFRRRFTLAMLTSVEDVDGLPERGKSSTTSHPLLNALHHSFARVLIKSIHRKPSVTFSAMPHTKFHLQCKIKDKFFLRYSYPLEKTRKTLEINWQHRALWTNKMTDRARTPRQYKGQWC